MPELQALRGLRGRRRLTDGPRPPPDEPPAPALLEPAAGARARHPTPPHGAAQYVPRACVPGLATSSRAALPAGMPPALPAATSVVMPAVVPAVVLAVTPAATPAAHARRAPSEEEREQAAVALEAAWRGLAGRRAVVGLRNAARARQRAVAHATKAREAAAREAARQETLVREAAARVAAAREAAAREEEAALVAIQQMEAQAEAQAEAEAEAEMEAELLGMAASCIQAGWRGYGVRLCLAMSPAAPEPQPELAEESPLPTAVARPVESIAESGDPCGGVAGIEIVEAVEVVEAELMEAHVVDALGEAVEVVEAVEAVQDGANGVGGAWRCMAVQGSLQERVARRTLARRRSWFMKRARPLLRLTKARLARVSS